LKDGTSVRRRWVFLYRWRGKLTEMRLGGFHSVSLAKAREFATAYRTDHRELPRRISSFRVNYF
jgi:hypothetical protein